MWSSGASAALTVEPTLVVDSTVLVVSSDSSRALPARRLTVAGGVTAALYDSSSQTIVIGYRVESQFRAFHYNDPTGTDGFIGLYDLADRKLRWSLKTDAIPVGMYANRLLLATPKQSTLIDRGNGNRICTLPPRTLLFRDDGLLVSIGDDAIVRYALETGDVVWRDPVNTVHGAAGGRLFPYRQGDMLLVSGDGLKVVDVQRGTGWEYALPASRTWVVSRTMTNLLTMGLGLLAGGLIIPEDWGGRALDLHSQPVVDGTRVYFAAETTVVSLDLRSGQCLWRHHLELDRRSSLRSRALGISAEPAFPGVLIARKAGGLLAVLACGWAPDKGRTWQADPPSLALLDLESGATVKHVPILGAELALYYEKRPEGHYVVTPERLIRFDDSLRVDRVYALHSPIVRLSALAPGTDDVLVQTTNGVLALSPDSLSLRWQRPMGAGLTWAAARDSDSALWMRGGRVLMRIGPANPPGPGLEFPLLSQALYFTRGKAVAIRDSSVMLINLEPRSMK